MGIAAAWTFSLKLMTVWVMLALVIAILGASTTLSPVIVLRLIFIVLGFQVRSAEPHCQAVHVPCRVIPPPSCVLSVAF